MNEQMLLIEAESDAALLLPELERRKRYTAGQVQQIEWKLGCILTMLAAGVIPLEEIAQRAHVNFRTVQELATRYAERIGQDAGRYAEYALAKSAKMAFLMDQKAEAASPRDLAVMHQVLRDTAINLRALGSGAEEEQRAIELQAEEDEGLKALRARLRTMALEAGQAPAGD